MSDAAAMSPDDVEALLGSLDERERNVLVLRLGLDRGDPRTAQEVGDLFDLPAERIREIERAALGKLRDPGPFLRLVE